ncbi:MAG: DUF998 domain-containing protein [Gemmatimonadaceae bacterium]
MRRRLLLMCGALSPLLYAFADALAGSRWAGYSFRDQTISELGAIGAPTKALFSALLIPTYLLLVAFGVGVWQSAAGRRRVRVVGGLIVVLGALALTVGQFAAMRTRGSEQGLAGALHLAEGMVAMVILLTAMSFAGVAFSRNFRGYTIITIVIVLAFGGWSAMDIPQVEAGIATPWVGVKERIFWYSYQLWFVVLAAVLLRERTREQS